MNVNHNPVQEGTQPLSIDSKLRELDATIPGARPKADLAYLKRKQEPTKENLFYIGKDGRDYPNSESLIHANRDYMNQMFPPKIELYTA